MAFFFSSLTKSHPQSHHHHRTFMNSATTIKMVRDRGLDHAVEKEKNLNTIINIKNLIKSEPSKSIPISIIADNKHTLQIPIRPVEFIRKYPSIFEEFLPGGISSIHPHIRLTPQVLNLDAEEQLIYQSHTHRQEATDRLLKLLMLCRINKIPLNIVDRLKWDMGLPQDYMQTLVPEFPDYFQIIDNEVLELVCWSNEFGISVMEKKMKKSMNRGMGCLKGMPIAFPLQYSRGFEMDKKFMRWVDEWQKLPYISPYENASHLSPQSDESDKWVVAVLHEFLHLLVPKKTDRENILCLGEYLGLRSRFKRALLNHPGIFYLSSKIGTRTVVLREAYKRDLLVEKNRMMGMRYQYIHLMNTVKEVPKSTSAPGGGHKKQQNQLTQNSKVGDKEEDDDDESEDEQMCDLSDSEDIDDNSNDDDDEDERHVSQTGARKNFTVNRGRTTRKRNMEVKAPWRNPLGERSAGRYSKTKDKVPLKVSKRTEMHRGDSVPGRFSERSDLPRHRGRSLPASRTFT